jgi:hypothetical protein
MLVEKFTFEYVYIYSTHSPVKIIRKEKKERINSVCRYSSHRTTLVFLSRIHSSFLLNLHLHVLHSSRRNSTHGPK